MLINVLEHKFHTPDVVSNGQTRDSSDWGCGTMRYIQDRINESSVRRVFLSEVVPCDQMISYEHDGDVNHQNSACYHKGKIEHFAPDDDPGKDKGGYVFPQLHEIYLAGKDTNGRYLQPDATTLQMVVDHFVREEWRIMLTLLDTTATKRKFDEPFGTVAFCNMVFKSMENFPEHGGCDEIVRFIVIHPTDEDLLPPQRFYENGHIWTADVITTDQMIPGNMLLLPDCDKVGVISEKLGMTGIGANGGVDDIEVLYTDCAYSVIFGDQARWVSTTRRDYRRRAPKLRGTDAEQYICKT